MAYELVCIAVAATLKLYETRFTRVVGLWAINANVKSSKTWNDSSKIKISTFFDILDRGHCPKYFPKVCSLPCAQSVSQNKDAVSKDHTCSL